ncbi:MAG TPA: response regulator [Oligoflexus sp.]|uniref:response regulator n=1 Tax=Oligoflexus sp. TaxID=1971216 RepID=UPI002D223A9A|nr:response regulator [Oligoflexus sp.]HYX38665.1 response regulator [Oligoflexus sp.]
MNILVVDDDAVMVELLQYFLEENGMSVTTAASPPEALEFLLHKKIDLVVSDAIMPGGGARRLLADILKTQPDMPVILMSGYGPNDLNLPDHHARGFWRKGEAIDNLIAMVKAVR